MVDASEHLIQKPSVVSDKKLVPSLDDQLDNVHSTCKASHDHIIVIMQWVALHLPHTSYKHAFIWYPVLYIMRAFENHD